MVRWRAGTFNGVRVDCCWRSKTPIRHTWTGYTAKVKNPPFYRRIRSIRLRGRFFMALCASILEESQTYVGHIQYYFHIPDSLGAAKALSLKAKEISGNSYCGGICLEDPARVWPARVVFHGCFYLGCCSFREKQNNSWYPAVFFVVEIHAFISSVSDFFYKKELSRSAD